MEKTDKINKPSHYQGKYGMEAIDVLRNFLTEEEMRGFHKGNALKYLLRERNKNGLEDLQKGEKNLGWLIECEEKRKAKEEDKQEIIDFLQEQRELRLVCYDESKPVESDFDRWQLAQADMFQRVIDWIEGVERK